MYLFSDFYVKIFDNNFQILDLAIHFLDVDFPELIEAFVEELVNDFLIFSYSVNLLAYSFQVDVIATVKFI